MELLAGCGNSRDKKVTFEGIPKEWSGELVTLDIDETCDPKVVHDLNQLPYPFPDDYFSEVHLYEVLEHCGTQGDWRFFFNQFEELHRILKPDGWLIGTCPMWDSPWAWGDPGHTRIMSPESLIFLSQSEYDKQVGNTAMTDYRSVYSADFELVNHQTMEHNWAFVLKAKK